MICCRVLSKAALCAGVMLLIGACSDRDGVTRVTPPAPPVSIPSVSAGISLTISDPSVTSGQVVGVSIDLQSNVPGRPIGAFQARLVFDTTQLAYEASDSGAGAVSVHRSADTLRLSGAAAGDGFATKRLATVRFRVNDPSALRTLSLHVDELVDVAFTDRRRDFGDPTAPIVPAKTVVVSAASDPPSIYGDATGEGIVSAADALAILTSVVGLSVPSGFTVDAADVNMDGKVTPLDAQIVLAFTTGATVPAIVRIGDAVGSLPVTITTVSPAVIVPGGTITITGTNFSTTLVDDTLLIDGIAATITSATPTTLTATAANTYPCRKSQIVPITLRSKGATARTKQTLRVGTLRLLAVGEWLAFDDPAEFRCNEFVDGHYVLAVYNPIRTWSPTAATIQVLGEQSIPRSASAEPPLLHVRDSVPSRMVAQTNTIQSLFGGTPIDDAMRQRVRAHLRLMERDRAIARRGAGYAARRTGTPGITAQVRAALSVSTTPGQYSSIRVISPTSETDYTTVRARTVYVGTRTIILEDSLAPLAQQMDQYYYKLGAEFDNVMFPILQENFGNPLAMDGNLDNNGRIIMLFTPVVNTQFQGAAAFVTACDFLSPTACPASNLAEVFYSAVPTKLNSANPANNPVDDAVPLGWYNWTRSTIIHEVKHITALAEKYSRSTDPVLEESWLEEGTAQVAAELYARAQYGLTWKQAAWYQQTIYCELRLCPNYSLNLINHFGFLHDYEQATEQSSPISPGWYDARIYGSAWMFARWAADQYATNESAFFKAIVRQTTMSGIANLEAQTGQAWPNMLLRWSLALVADDRDGMNAPITIPSWQTRDIFNGMRNDLPSSIMSPALKILQFFPSTSYAARVPIGSVQFTEMTLPSNFYQVIAIRATSSTDLPADTPLRLAILRVP